MTSPSPPSINIGIYGAFDRFNYGDILFPILLERALAQRLPEASFRYYSTTDSNLCALGGPPTTAIRKRIRDKTPPKDEHMIIAGGNTLSVRPSFLHQCSAKNALERKALSFVSRRISEETADRLSRFFLLPGLEHPFTFSKQAIPGIASLIYNAVGGQSIRIPQEELLGLIAEADYFSVRDRSTQDNLRQPSGAAPFLVPDSAATLPKYISAREIQEKQSTATRELLQQHTDGYICFQIVESSYRGNETMIRDQLALLSGRSGLPIVLLPIGRAARHEDQKALEPLSHLLDKRATLAPEGGIYDVLSVVTSASVFIGTSLHGTITSNAYAVPSLGISPRIQKLTAYIDTWGDPALSGPVQFPQIAEAALNCLKQDKVCLSKTSEELAAKAEINFDAIAETITNREPSSR